MKILTFHLDDLAAAGNYAGMVRAAAAYLGMPVPENPQIELDVLDRAGFVWEAIVFYGNETRTAYCRDGRITRRASYFPGDCIAISEMREL